MRQDELWDGFYSTRPRAWRGNARVPDPGVRGEALDLGCGNGKTTSTLVDMGFSVTGVDFSSVAVASCSERFGDTARFATASATDLPFGDGTFSYVTCVHILEHLSDDELGAAVGEIRRVLVPGGYVFTRTFTDSDLRSDSRSRGDIRYVYRTVEGMVRAFAGFETVSSELVEETTRFGAVRSRVECLFRLPVATL